MRAVRRGRSRIDQVGCADPQVEGSGVVAVHDPAWLFDQLSDPLPPQLDGWASHPGAASSAGRGAPRGVRSALPGAGTGCSSRLRRCPRPGSGNAAVPGSGRCCPQVPRVHPAGRCARSDSGGWLTGWHWPTEWTLEADCRWRGWTTSGWRWCTTRVATTRRTGGWPGATRRPPTSTRRGRCWTWGPAPGSGPGCWPAGSAWTSSRSSRRRRCAAPGGTVRTRGCGAMWKGDGCRAGAAWLDLRTSFGGTPATSGSA